MSNQIQSPYFSEFKVFIEGYHIYISKGQFVEKPNKDMETCTVNIYVPLDDTPYRKFDLKLDTKLSFFQAMEFFRTLGFPLDSQIVSLAYGGNRLIKLEEYWLTPEAKRVISKSSKLQLKADSMQLRTPRNFHDFFGNDLSERISEMPGDKWVMFLAPLDSGWKGAWIQYADTTDETNGMNEKSILYEDTQLNQTRFNNVLAATSVPLNVQEKKKLEDMIKIALPI